MQESGERRGGASEEVGEGALVFRARVTPGFQLFVLGMAVMLAGGILLAVLLAASGDPGFASNPVFWVGNGMVALSLVLIVPLFLASTTLWIGSETVRVNCAWLSQTEFSLADLESVEEGPVTGLAQGLGSRVLGPAHTGYLTGGYSVNFYFKDGKTITVSCDDPDGAVAAVRARAGGAPS